MTIRETTLPNGLRILSDQMPHLHSAAVGVWVDVGARHESPDLNGVSHMLEHMAFKGTERRSAQDIAEEIEAVGGHLNAYTSREHTAYYARVLGDDVPLAIDIIADILQHPAFEPEEVKRERAVIIQEIGQASDTPDDIVFDYLQQTAYPDQAIGRSILGTVDTVSSFTPDILGRYLRHHYCGPGMVLVGTGAIDHDRLVDLASAAFGGLKRANGNSLEPAYYDGGDFRLARDLEQVHLTLAFDGIPYRDTDFYVAQVFSAVLGGGMSSRLFQEVREKRGLCYSVFSFASSYVDGGMVGIYAGTGEAEIGELVPVLADEAMKLISGVGEEETVRGRAQLKAGLLMGLESPTARAEQLARQILVFGRTLAIDEIVSRIDAVTPQDISRFAERVFRGSQPTVAALGPLGQLESYDRIAARFA